MGSWHLIIVSHKWKIVNKEKKYLNNFLHLKPIITTLCWGLSRRNGARQLLNTFWRFYQPRATFAFSEQFLSKLASRLRKKPESTISQKTSRDETYSENAISRGNCVQVPSYRSARCQMKHMHVVCSIQIMHENSHISPIFASNCF